ncbi:hypothetical protein SPRG_13758 [Saprolegnia parasitica CBS 223.65]|uniref:Uncharacterized protein n=1 Tax=Saprolegnia parasitica (strain CBS 223.65) TaxID=695850 RepID=A0A067C1E2_SAPPC|nr:hypothetical protein SPRG_13758 [Saprolegnia parasitica CBS 223.65]KDO20376.1 hypothetical protein SPRG_13758 [Saprolegnia parasitica CBS 223.65]|eukprot:XP_012208904.1 hypothetical protein SPRG_13758 [Saprolegnia parasitica CBS 223.65]
MRSGGSTVIVPIGPTISGVVATSAASIHVRQLYRAAVVVIGAAILMLVAVDTFANNWALNDYIGNGNCFKTPIATVLDFSGVSAAYTFRHDLALDDVSQIGGWMLNYTVAEFTSVNSDYYVVSAGAYEMPATTDLCSIFQGEYDVSVRADAIKIGAVTNSITFMRGSAWSHLFTKDASEGVATSKMKRKELSALGYLPTRLAVDLRLSDPFNIANTSETQHVEMSYYRFFPRSFCSGCTPIVELGHGSCNFTLVYNDATASMHVQRSANIDKSIYKLGLMQPKSAFSSASHYLKAIAIAFALGGYLGSRKTVQWSEVDHTVTDSIFAKLLRTISPKYFPYPSLALDFRLFCYNSDLFVLLFATSVLLDMSNCFVAMRNMQLYNSLSPQFGISLQLYALEVRLLWINCLFLKVLKLGWGVLSTASYSGESRLMGYLNLSSVTSLYLSAAVLFFVPSFIEFNNSVTIELYHSAEILDPIHIDAFDGFYLRCIPAIVLLLILNMLGILTLDHVLWYQHWTLLAKNSLARQAIFNSSSIVCDYLDGVVPDTEVGSQGSLLICKARRLSTLQWFFMNHLRCFGLPEKELRAKKKMLQTSEDVKNNAKCIIAQDGDGHIHLLDAGLNDVTALVYNIKILKDATVAIQ